MISVPDDEQHIAAFRGVIGKLGTWQIWADDVFHSGKQLAAIWRAVVDNIRECPDPLSVGFGGQLEDCGMRLRISPDNSCIIQCFDECAQTWGDWFDVTKCAPGAVSQEGPGGTPDVGSQNCYDIVIPGNSPWISPIPIQDGDTVDISLVGGGWFDGAGWYCPNGQTYVLGACTGAGVTSGSDPAPSLLHGRLIASTDGGSSWQDGFNTSPVIAVGQAPTNLLLQMNDDSLSDNGGSIHLQVCITHNAVSTWSHTFDFTLASGGWVPYGGNFASWVPGTGWIHGSAAVEAVYAAFTCAHDSIFTRVSLTFTTNAPHVYYQGCAIQRTGPHDLARNDALAESPGGTLNQAGLSQIVPAGDQIVCAINTDTSVTSLILTSALFEGTGFDPFA